MVLKVAATAVTTILPSQYYLHALVAIITILVVHAFAQGRKTNRERDLHARVILVTVRPSPPLFINHYLIICDRADSPP